MNDNVPQIRNRYSKEVYDGDIWRIIKMNVEDQEITVILDGRGALNCFKLVRAGSSSCL